MAIHKDCRRSAVSLKFLWEATSFGVRLKTFGTRSLRWVGHKHSSIVVYADLVNVMKAEKWAGYFVLYELLIRIYPASNCKIVVFLFLEDKCAMAYIHQNKSTLGVVLWKVFATLKNSRNIFNPDLWFVCTCCDARTLWMISRQKTTSVLTEIPLKFAFQTSPLFLCAAHHETTWSR